MLVSAAAGVAASAPCPCRTAYIFSPGQHQHQRLCTISHCGLFPLFRLRFFTRTLSLMIRPSTSTLLVQCPKVPRFSRRTVFVQTDLCAVDVDGRFGLVPPWSRGNGLLKFEQIPTQKSHRFSQTFRASCMHMHDHHDVAYADWDWRNPSHKNMQHE